MTLELDERSVKKINLIDKFRERFSASDNEKLKLPQIIVVGDQSSGKSSILEAISGIKLPRGVNTVTKCPVIIQMRYSDVERKQIKCRDDTFRDIENTEAEINRAQRQIFQNHLTEEPITLHIESPKVQTLTIIDLPGFVKTQTSDQTDDIIDMTHNIAKIYMNQENSLIVCVLPANQDISTTTTIKLATECNTSKSRIIGVLTKLDKIDDKEASLIPDILQNRKLPIKKGYYGLVVSDEFLALDSINRRIFEMKSFSKNNLWKEEHMNRLGLTKFIEALVRELMLLINERLPQLELNIKKEIKETEIELTKCSKYYDNQAFRSHYIEQISSVIAKKIKNILVNADVEIQEYPEVLEFLNSEKYLANEESDSTFLFLWHRVFKRLHDGFRERVKELFHNGSKPYKDLDILDELIKRCRVENILVFNYSKPFKIIMNKILSLLKEESLKCVESCCKIITNLIHQVLIIGIEEQFSAIKTDILEICLGILDTQQKKMISLLDSIFESEHSYFTQDTIAETYSYEGTNIHASMLLLQSSNKLLSIFGESLYPFNQYPQYSHAKKLKDYLVIYTQNLILRLSDSIPNLIRLILFVNFKKAVKSQFPMTLLTPDRLEKYFSLDSTEEERWARLKEKQRHLEQSKSDLDNLMHFQKLTRDQAET